MHLCSKCEHEYVTMWMSFAILSADHISLWNGGAELFIHGLGITVSQDYAKEIFFKSVHLSKLFWEAYLAGFTNEWKKLRLNGVKCKQRVRVSQR